MRVFILLLVRFGLVATFWGIAAHSVDHMFSMYFVIIIPPANCVCGRVYCFHVVRPSVCGSVTFCFLNILKNH